MYCIRCGKEIPADAAFCPLCGARQEEPPVQGACAVPPAASAGAQSVPGGERRPKSSVPPYRGPLYAEERPHTAAPPQRKPVNGFGIAGMVTGILALFLNYLFIFTLAISIVSLAVGCVAVMLSIAALIVWKKCRGNGFAVAGLIVSGISVEFSLLLFILYRIASM